MKQGYLGPQGRREMDIRSVNTGAERSNLPNETGMTSDISGSKIQDRKRTLILRGMVGVEQEKVRQVLKSYGIGVEGLVRVAPRRQGYRMGFPRVQLARAG